MRSVRQYAGMSPERTMTSGLISALEGHTFRVRFRLGRRVRIHSDTDVLVLADDTTGDESVQLRPRDRRRRRASTSP